MSKVELKPIRYIGQKARKSSEGTVPGSNVRWDGHGDVQWVPEALAVILMRHQDVWELATDIEEPEGGGLGELARRAATQRYPTDPKARGPVQAPPRPPSSSPPSDPRAAEATQSPETIGADPLEKVTTVAEAQMRIEQCILAMKKLRRKDYGANGKPKATALASILGRTVTAEERDHAWNAVMAQRAKEEGREPPPIDETPDVTDGDAAGASEEASNDVPVGVEPAAAAAHSEATDPPQGGADLE